MKTLLYYPVQVIICSGILYSYYHFVLRNKKFHSYNRYYLLASVVVSILIPFFNIPVYFSARADQSAIIHTLTIIAPAQTELHTSEPGVPVAPVFTFENAFKLFYLTAGAFILIRLLFSLLQVKRLLHKYVVERVDHIRFINTDEAGTPFSFFNWLFWNRKIDLGSTQGQQIFRHELFHIEQKHSWDIMFMEIVSVFFWMNPFFYFIKKEIKAIHEFLADEFATGEKDKWNYAELLLMQVLNTRSHRLINPFFHNQVKRRIAMITSPQKPGHQYLRKIMVLPVAAIVVAIFAFTYKHKNTPIHYEQHPKVAGSEIGDSKYHYRVKRATNRFHQDHAGQRHFPEIKTGSFNVTSPDTVPNSLRAIDCLIVIDGKKMKDSAQKILGQLDPRTIESMRILKGDTAMAKYGEDGRKGVIEIDTKKNYKPLPENRGDSMPPEESRNSEPATRNIVEKIGEKKLETRPLPSPGDSGFRGR